MLADVAGTANTGLTWFLPEGNSTYGSITSSGAYSAPFTTANLNVLMRATSVADPSKTATSSIALRPGISADTMSPASGSGMSQIFTGTLTLRDLSSTTGTYVYTENTFDSLDRVTQVTRPGGATILTAYQPDGAKNTDKSSIARLSNFDALGRLIAVTEDSNWSKPFR